MGIDHLQEYLTALLGDPCLISSTVKFPDVQIESSVLKFVLVASCSVDGHCWKLPSGIYTHLKGFPWAISSAVPSLFLLSYTRCSSPLSIFMTLFQIPYRHKYVHIFLLLGSPELDMSFHCWVEGKDHISQPGSNISPNPAHEVFGLLCCKGIAMISLRSTRAPRSW